MDSAASQVLVINCGSSSVKYRLLAMDRGELLAGGLVERIGESGSLAKRSFQDETGRLVDECLEVPVADHRAAFRHIDEALRAFAAFEDGARLAAIGHRVVHGGEAFSAPTLIDARIIGSIRALSALAPLHNPANLTGIKLCRERFPHVPQVAVFDTAFHQTMPPRAYRYAVPEEWYERDGIRRYGFHGSSHRYVAARAAAHVGRALTDLRMITLHLGNGASICAIDKGRCVDTSMGFTPLEGLVMGTRCGDVDPAVPLHMQKVLGTDAEGMERMLNRESGLKGLCGTNDMREILAKAAARDADAELALDLYCYRIKKYVGAYTAALGSLDVLVFTGGVGENAAEVRRRICQGIEVLGIALNEDANREPVGEVLEIGRAGIAVRTLVVRTNEELQIAQEALTVVRAMRSGDRGSPGDFQRAG